jgi:hypothetical protein
MALHRRASSLRYRALIALALLAAAAGCSGTPEQPDNARVCQAYAGAQDHVEVYGEGHIVALLGTSEGQSGEHEGFLLRLDGSCDLLVRVEVNTDITGPIPLHPGELAKVKGEYETDPTGGVIHWTHHDPRGRHEAGYIVAGGKTYG